MNEYNFKTSKTNPIIIDCGANIGMSILYFKKLYPNAKILAFEANPFAFKLLEQNIKKNNITDVEIKNIALYDSESEISFYIGENIGSLVGSINTERGGNNELKVRAEKLSKYIENYDSIDLIKMDVEGSESNIVKDLYNAAVLNKVKEYIIEYHLNINEDRSSLSNFLKYFEDNGFNYNLRASYSEIKSFQDVVIHFYKNSD